MKIKITKYIFLKTYSDENVFFREVGGDDLCFKTKKEMINALSNDKNINTNIGVYYLKLNGNTVLKLRDKIIDEIVKINHQFKWIRLYYDNIELNSEDEKDFEAYKRCLKKGWIANAH